jgi:hypothetical protein
MTKKNQPQLRGWRMPCIQLLAGRLAFKMLFSASETKNNFALYFNALSFSGNIKMVNKK